MTPPLDLSSADAKFERAKFHAHELQDNIRKWVHDDVNPVIRIGLEDDPKRQRTLAYAESIKDVPPEWGLILGDALHNYRSALNHAVGALVLIGSNPEAFVDPDSGFQFPVCDTSRSDFFAPKGRVRKSQLPGVPLKYLRAISQFQPYHRRRSRWALSALKLLNDLDKHRKPILATHHVAAQLASVPLGYGEDTKTPVGTFKSLRPRGRLQPGTKLAYLIWLTNERPIILVPPYGPLRGKPEVTMHFHSVSAVVIEELFPGRVVLVDGFIQAADRLVDEVLGKLRQV